MSNANMISDANMAILEAAGAITGLDAEIDRGEIVIIADNSLAERADDPEVSAFLSLHKSQAVYAALRDAAEDLSNPEIAGDGDYKADCAAISKVIEDELKGLPKLRESVSSKAIEVMDGHVRQIHEGLAPRLKIWIEGDMINAVLVSVFVRAIQSSPVPVVPSDPESIFRGVKKALSEIAPGLAA